MFKSLPVTPVVLEPPDALIPLSVLHLDLPTPPTGWQRYLTDRDIPITTDDIGRKAVTRDVARMLIAEHAEAEERRRAAMARVEQQAIEAYQAQYASIWRGVSADAIPVGVQPATAMLQAAKDAEPKRSTPLEEAFSNSPGMNYHQFSADEE
jgi:hypothetical protein